MGNYVGIGGKVEKDRDGTINEPRTKLTIDSAQ
jgi:hypothetical protein